MRCSWLSIVVAIGSIGYFGCAGEGTPESATVGESALDGHKPDDRCPNDPKKTEPGRCGCATPETDSDRDGAPDCVDECPNDARYIARGPCGCMDAPAPEGSACFDALCGCAARCDAHATCGDPRDCSPDSSCSLRYFHTAPYWFCDRPRHCDDAREHCRAANMELAVIDDADENAFVGGHVQIASFIGASDEPEAGSWSWLPTKKQFWDGGRTGAPVGDAHADWDHGEPDDGPTGKHCAVIDPHHGLHWRTESCQLDVPYVCERVDACPNDPSKLQPGQCGCGIPDTDSDSDQLADCLDACPRDAGKEKPGICGCGQPDTDSDGDGIPDCVDECPRDDDPTAGGTCGCPSNAAASGTSCCDGICGTGVCDGAGHCGAAASTCAPVPFCGCQAVRVAGTAYWFCSCNRSRDAADTACAAVPGRQLLQIDNASENTLVTALLSGDTWIGANDRQNEGEWHWTKPQHGDTGRLFWDGDAVGTPHFGRYANWQSTEPGGGASANCAQLTAAGPNAGSWSDRACAATLQFACENGLQRLECAPVDVPSACEILGENCQTPAEDEANCSSLAEAFIEPTAADQLQAFANCDRCVSQAANPEVDCVGPWPTSADPVPCAGSSAPPPPNSTCPSFRAGMPADHQFLCALVPGTWSTPYASCETMPCTTGQCGLVSSCTVCPAGQVCPCQEQASCPGPNNICRGIKVCGTPVPVCPSFDTDEPARCQELELCASETLIEEHAFDDLAPGSDLSTVPAEAIAEAFGPADEPANAMQVPADPPCPDAPDPQHCPASEQHRWCKYETPKDLKPRTVESPMRNGDAGNPGSVEFYFRPDIDYGYDVFPGPFGLMQFQVGASASLTAGVELHVFNADESLDVIDFLLEARAGLHDADLDEDDLCGISTGKSHLLLLEQFDILPTDFRKQLPEKSAQLDCIQAIKEFLDTVNRVKKAYSDARELLRQYKAFGLAGTNFGIGLDGLCDQVVSTLPLGFPAIINCLDLRPEELLNRFVDYYYDLALNRLANEVANRVADSIDVAFDATSLGLDLAEIHNTEEITLFNQTFLIGPIPVVLQGMFTAAYGLELDGKARFQPSSLIRQVLFNGSSSASAEQPFAYVGAVALPYAGAGLALFVGVGFDIGVLAASVGIEGSVSLGKVALPIEAGAGIAISSQIDKRAPASDLDTDYVLVNDTPLIPLKQYSINAVYKYGATLKLEDILSGKIDAAVKLKFLFFSKKWRAHLARFNGFCTPANPKPFCNIDIFGGYGTVASVPFEMVDWGRALLPSSFLQLKRIQPAQYRPAGGVPFDTSLAGGLFFDSVCTCIPRFSEVPAGQTVRECTITSDCCGDDLGEVCFADPEANGFHKCSLCRNVGEACSVASDCCSLDAPNTCLDLPNDNLPYGTCQPKSTCSTPCSTDEDCDDTTVFGDLFCYTPDSGAPDFTPQPEQRNCRKVDDPTLAGCVVLQ